MNAKAIKQYALEQWDIAINIDDIQWLLNHWEGLANKNDLQLSSKELATINKQINTVVTGKRKKHHIAKEAVISYLSGHLHWEVPKKIENKFIDKKNEAFNKAEQYRAISDAIYKKHCSKVELALENKAPIELSLCIAELLFNTSPLKPTYLSMALKQQSFNFSYNPALLEIDIAVSREHSQWLRFELSTTVAVLFKRVAKLTDLIFSEKKIQSLIVNYFQSLTAKKMSARTVNSILRCHWRTKMNDWAVNDIFNVEQQHALTPERYKQLVSQSNNPKSKGELKKLALFDKNICHIDSQAVVDNHKKEKPQYQQLLNTYKNKGRYETVTSLNNENKKSNKKKENNSIPLFIDEQNLVFDFLYDFTKELILEGGPKVKQLKGSSISEYTSLFNLIKKTAFIHKNELEDGGINEWAAALWEQTQTDSQKNKLHRFFQFIYFHPMGEELDMNRFQPVTVPKICDANLITPGEFKQIQRSLTCQDTPDFFQFLCCYVGLTLAYQGCLRRRELIRLRIIDCEIANIAGDVYRLCIMRTKEGSTKSKKTRYVYLSLTESEQTYLNLLLKLKKNVNPNMPLLGYTKSIKSKNRWIDVPESIFQRESNYLLPITKAIKAICGQNARFYHLRHGGIYLLFCQGRKLFFPDAKAPQIFSHNEMYLQAEYTHKRFNYWIKGREISNLNKNQLLNEIIKMIGHESIQTTRFSYLHGHEWLPYLFEENTLTVTKKEMRLLWGLPLQSSDLSRKLTLLEETFGEEGILTVNRNDKAIVIDQKTLKTCTQSTAHHWVKIKLIDSDNAKDKKETKTVIFNVLQNNTTLWNLFFTDYLHSLNSQKKVFLDGFTILSNVHSIIGKTASTLTEGSVSIPLLIDVLAQINNSQNSVASFVTTKSEISKLTALLSTPFFKALKPKITLFINKKTKPKRVISLAEQLKKDTKFHSKIVINKINSGHTAFILEIGIAKDIILLINNFLFELSRGSQHD